MLVVTIKETELISEAVKLKTTDGEVVIRYIKSQGKRQVRIGIDAPKNIKIDRVIYDRTRNKIDK